VKKTKKARHHLHYDKGVNYSICSHALQLLLVINTTLVTMEGLVGVSWQSCYGMMKGVRISGRIKFASFQHHVGTLCQERCIRMPFWHRDNQTNKFISRAHGRHVKVTSQRDSFVKEKWRSLGGDKTKGSV